jgi:hypothetical protein
MRVESAVQVWCDEYERLLKDCQITLMSWNSRRAIVHNSARRGRDADNELRTLQANFAKAWALLQYHENGCDVCQANLGSSWRTIEFGRQQAPTALSLNWIFLN